MNIKPLPLRSWTTFFYGLCSEDKLTDMVKDAELHGCELVQVIAGMIPPPRTAVALPGASQVPIPVLRLLVRTPDENYAKLVAERDQAQSKLVH